MQASSIHGHERLKSQQIYLKARDPSLKTLVYVISVYLNVKQSEQLSYMFHFV